ncbi:SUMO-activating enzyme subunit 1 [Condylostylus longicornis]|uniref:SUMO-activating enzyme subunit 1 n=1 Tax=Condylostylus longicornis TaxID=2530218 RepID=UPI00244E4027|nr:SUMO-activating enzyme subunit 1 [Condylostylus longicornis]
MVENNDIALTEHEAELYDRQIRLWGLEAQKRLRGSKILIAGVNGLGAEVAKNIILAGVKSVTLLDDQNVTLGDSCSQFLSPVDSIGLNRAEASIHRARALNPMVEITADKENISEKKDEFFENFDVVVVIGASIEELLRIDNICRSKNIKFFSADVWGMFGYSFADLQIHEFVEDKVKHKVVSKPHEKSKTELVTSTMKRTLEFPEFKRVIEFDYNTPAYAKRMKRVGPAFPLLRILQEFRTKHKRDPNYEKRMEDIEELKQIRDEIADKLVPDNDFETVFAQISPVAAIVGGQLAQEVIKTVSKKEAPNLNVFLFDPNTCKGFIEAIE